MLKRQHKNISKLLLARVFCLLFCFFALTTLLLAFPRPASAATYSNVNSNVPCGPRDTNAGNYTLDPPFKAPDGNIYYCVTGLTAAEVTLANAHGDCPAGIPGISTVVGPACITNPDKNIWKFNAPPPINTGDSTFSTASCGDPSEAVNITIDLGCKHEGNPIVDAAFAIIRFLSFGVGLVIIASTIVAGIQYSASRGDPAATAKAIDRVRNNLIAVLVFMFAYPIINWLIPAGLLK